MAYTVFRSDNMPGIDNRAYVKSVLVKDARDGNPIEVENGTIVILTKLLKRDLWEAVPYQPDYRNTGDTMAILGTPEVIYHDCLKHNLDDFINEAGTPAMAYMLRDCGGTFAVTADGFENKTTPNVDSLIGIGVNGKLSVVSSLEDGAVANCRAIEKAGRYTYYVIEIM